jgi:hypothetical protein
MRALWLYAHLGVSKLHRLRQLEEKSSRFETVGRLPPARQARALGGPARKSEPARRRELVQWFRAMFQVSRARACRLAQLGRASWHRRSHAQDHPAWRIRNRDLAHAPPRLGHQRIWDFLRREG